MELRVQRANDRPSRPRGDYVLYWMIAARRSTWNFALDHAIARARELDRPLLVFEPLRAGYRWASDRMHAFVIDGMADNAKAFAKAGITYLSYVEPEPGAGKGLLEALAARACCVITDEQPGFFQPHMVRAVAARLPVAMETVDSCGVFPLRAFDKPFTAARWFRRAWQQLPHLTKQPHHRPLAKIERSLRDAEVRATIARRWPSANDIADIAIDHGVPRVSYSGGSEAAAETLDDFATRATHYADRNHPDANAASGLSPYLHFGHISAHEVFARIDEPGFRDELVTWRELSFNFCFHRDDHDQYSALPAWARATLAKHADDPRPERYTPHELEHAQTGDEIWNAAQRELVREGRIHNYLRMLWGKKILEWSPTPQRAFATMVELNNKYGVDGRDPNSYAGILWTLGLFDRAWGPERPIFGTIRYMSSAATKRKLEMKRYLATYASASAK